MAHIAREICVTDDLVQRFWKKVQPIHDEDSCWRWTGGLSKGYGRIRVGRDADKYLALSHRVSWAIHHGSLSVDELVLHICVDSRSCVRPSHLYLGDYKQNALDAVNQGHHPTALLPGEWKGMKNSWARLTDDQIRSIRSTPKVRGSQRRLAEKHGVSEASISLIVNGKSWTHI